MELGDNIAERPRSFAEQTFRQSAFGIEGMVFRFQGFEVPVDRVILVPCRR